MMLRSSLRVIPTFVIIPIGDPRLVKQRRVLWNKVKTPNAGIVGSKNLEAS